MQIQQSLYSQGVSGSTESSNQVDEANDILGRDDFLKVLITQLRHQDPLNPMDDRDFIAQMAQFSTLEQMLNIREAVDKLVDKAPAEGHFAQHAQLIGRMVSWHEDEEGEVTAQGIVQSVSFKNGEVYVEVAGKEEKLSLDAIVQITAVDEA